MTDPAGTVGSNASTAVPGVSPAVTSAWSAFDSVMFRRSGTATSSWPETTVTVIFEPRVDRGVRAGILGGDRPLGLVVALDELRRRAG